MHKFLSNPHSAVGSYKIFRLFNAWPEADKLLTYDKTECNKKLTYYGHKWHTNYLYFWNALCLLARTSGNSVSFNLRFIRRQLSESESSAVFSSSTSLSLVITSWSSASATLPPALSLHSTQDAQEYSSHILSYRQTVVQLYNSNVITID